VLSGYKDPAVALRRGLVRTDAVTDRLAGLPSHSCRDLRDGPVGIQGGVALSCGTSDSS